MNRLTLPLVSALGAAFVLLAVDPAGALTPLPPAEPRRPAVSTPAWPPVWPRPSEPAMQTDFSAVRFAAPTAPHCRRLPGQREVPGVPADGQASDVRSRGEPARKAGVHRPAPWLTAAAERAESAAHPRPLPAPVPAPMESRPSQELATSAPGSSQGIPQDASRVTAGVVDDNADFGEYLAYRQRRAPGLSVRDRDVSERYALQVTDAAGRPVADAEVAVQRAGVAAPVAWARTDTGGRVWIHPAAFLGPDGAADASLGIAVRKGHLQSAATLRRGQSHAVDVTLSEAVPVSRPRLDLVFLVDATGSMGDEIAKLKASMLSMSRQLGSLPGRPDICYGLVAYRDQGDAYITRTHDFTDRLGAFQDVLGRVEADGGGDTPEALNEALHETVHGLSWRADAARMVVLVADAPPQLGRGGPQYDREMQAALAKGIKIFPVGASGLQPDGEFIFRQLAQYTAGKFVFLTYQDAPNPASGAGSETVHDVRGYSVQSLDRLVVRLVAEEMARLAKV